MADWERTATHLPSRFTKTSIQTLLAQALSHPFSAAPVDSQGMTSLVVRSFCVATDAKKPVSNEVFREP